MEIHLDQIFSVPHCRLTKRHQPTFYIFPTRPHNLSSVRGTGSRAPFHHSRDLERSTYSTPNSLCYQPNHREHLEWRPGSFGLGLKPRLSREANIPDRSIQITIATNCMRPTIRFERITGSGRRVVGAMRSQGASTDEVLRSRARGKRLWRQ